MERVGGKGAGDIPSGDAVADAVTAEGWAASEMGREMAGNLEQEQHHHGAK